MATLPRPRLVRERGTIRKPLWCEECERSEKSEWLLFKHHHVHHVLQVFRCMENDCDRHFNNLGELIKHRRRHETARIERKAKDMPNQPKYLAPRNGSSPSPLPSPPLPTAKPTSSQKSCAQCLEPLSKTSRGCLCLACNGELKRKFKSTCHYPNCGLVFRNQNQCKKHQEDCHGSGGGLDIAPSSFASPINVTEDLHLNITIATSPDILFKQPPTMIVQDANMLAMLAIPQTNTTLNPYELAPPYLLEPPSDVSTALLPIMPADLPVSLPQAEYGLLWPEMDCDYGSMITSGIIGDNGIIDSCSGLAGVGSPTLANGGDLSTVGNQASTQPSDGCAISSFDPLSISDELAFYNHMYVGNEAMYTMGMVQPRRKSIDFGIGTPPYGSQNARWLPSSDGRSRLTALSGHICHEAEVNWSEFG